MFLGWVVFFLCVSEGNVFILEVVWGEFVWRIFFCLRGVAGIVYISGRVCS